MGWSRLTRCGIRSRPRGGERMLWLGDAIKLRAWVALGMRRLRRVPPGLPGHGGGENGEVEEPDERASGDFQHTQHNAPRHPRAANLPRSSKNEPPPGVGSLGLGL